MKIHKSVPTNIITGFLGVGKTTAILHLLANKPQNERWAVLVNEFGEVGLDGEIMSGAHGQETGIFIREVSGGCMCCTSGLSMQIALNMLLAKAKPDRLLIEPTGLGHPKEVLSVLSAEHYNDVLSLGATITLVDARKIGDSRYTNHDTFNQQLEVADIIVANKQDKYESGDFKRLSDYIEAKGLLPSRPLYSIDYGKIQIEWLNHCVSTIKSTDEHQHTHSHKNHSQNLNTNPLIEPDIPDSGYMKIENQGEGFFSIGWRFKSSFIFDREKLFGLLTGIEAERLKAIFITNDGVYVYNIVDKVLSVTEFDEADENRIEIIAGNKDKFDYLESAILQCAL